jgi:hypothetical protein
MDFVIKALQLALLEAARRKIQEDGTSALLTLSVSPVLSRVSRERRWRRRRRGGTQGGGAATEETQER